MFKKIVLTLLIGLVFFMGITYVYAQEENLEEGEDKSQEVVETPAQDDVIQTTSTQSNEVAASNEEVQTVVVENQNEESQAVVETEEVVEIENSTEESIPIVDNQSSSNEGSQTTNENYNVHFHYSHYKVTMAGGQSIAVSKIFRYFKLDGTINDIESIRTSNYSVVSITKEGNDYIIHSLKAFNTNEEIIIVMKNKDVYKINITDPATAPAHEKTLTDNGDGTYILELTVTGDADNVQQASGNVDFILIYDVSSSMNTSDVTVNNRNYTRADQAEAVVNNFLTNLAGYQNDNKDNIRVALVTFAVTATQTQGWTTNITGVANNFEATGTNGRTNLQYTGNSHNGTNWEHALQLAQALVDTAREGVPTFVLLFTDGAPTAASGYNAISPTGASMSDLRARYNAATDEAYAIAQAVTPTNGMFFGIYAYGDTEREADLLDDLMYYSVNGQHRGGNINNVIRITEDAPNYAFAGDAGSVQRAIDKVFDKMVQAMGIASVTITDGTTNNVETSSGRIAELLEVDTTSYEYWISIPVVNNTFTRVDRNDNTITYTVNCNNNNCTVTWNGHSVSVQGSISGGQFKYKWTSANDLYDYDAPTATFEDGAVTWNLSSVGTLLDGVTYSVTFKVYPSQETLDYVADIKNNPGEDGAWASLDPAIREYIDVNGNLKTNTTATLTFVDTRTGESGDATYINPEPVETYAVEAIAVTKVWENNIDDRRPDPVTLTVTRDGVETYTIKLSDDNDWTKTVYVSIGIIVLDDDGYTVLSGAEGHDFTFTEPEDLSYRWELDVPVVHPMLIDGVVTMLIKVDEKHPAPEGAETYVINGATYYVDDAAVALTATNDRRSRLFLVKEVTGKNAPEDATFAFTVNVVNSKAPETEPENDPNHASDYWVWLSIFDAEDNGIDEGVTGATSYGGGYWYAPSGTDISIVARVGYSIMVNNLPSGSTYTITETDMPTGFVYNNTDLTILYGGTDSTFNGGLVTTGTIESTNSEYHVTYTNEYALVDVTVNKVWDDAGDQDGIRPDDLTLTLNGLPTGVSAPDPVITVSTDTNTWTYTWTGLPKYDDELNPITYTVTEENVPTGYTCTQTTVNNGGTITNTHVTEKTTVTVEKEWVGSATQDGKDEPTVVHVILKANGTQVGEVVELTGPNWSHTWTDLEMYADGDLIDYTVEEVEEGLISLTEKEGFYYSTVDGFKITNTYISVKTTVTVEKEWVGSATQDGKDEPTVVHVILKANGTQVGEVAELTGPEWSYTWSDIDLHAEDGSTITYTVEEVEEGLISLTEKEGFYYSTVDGFKITNTYISVKTTVTVEKEWVGSATQDGKDEPTVVHVILKANGTQVGEVVELTGPEWSYTWSDLDLHAEDGSTITYTVEEVEEGLISLTEKEGFYYSTVDGFKITNTYISVKTTVTVEKEWVGSATQDGKDEPTVVHVILKANGTQVGDVVELTGPEWSYTWSDIDLHAEDGSTITYTVEEVEEGLISLTEKEGFYYSTVDGFKITNTYISLKRDITVDKVWDDKNNYNNSRPTTVTISLYANGELIDTVILSDPEWSYTWYGLDINDEDGNFIEYSIDEEKVPNYEPEITGNADDGFVVTNVYNGTGGDIPTDNPNTGDNIMTYIAMIIISLVGLLTFSYKYVKNN